METLKEDKDFEYLENGKLKQKISMEHVFEPAEQINKYFMDLMNQINNANALNSGYKNIHDLISKEKSFLEEINKLDKNIEIERQHVNHLMKNYWDKQKLKLGGIIPVYDEKTKKRKDEISKSEFKNELKKVKQQILDSMRAYEKTKKEVIDILLNKPETKEPEDKEPNQ